MHHNIHKKRKKRSQSGGRTTKTVKMIQTPTNTPAFTIHFSALYLKAVDSYLQLQDIIPHTKYRYKSKESLHRKLASLNTQHMADFNDALGFRYVTQTTEQCYEALEHLLSLGFEPIYKLSDSLFESNGRYSSLDVNFISEDKKHYFQWQSRTEQSEFECENHHKLNHDVYEQNQLQKAINNLQTKQTQRRLQKIADKCKQTELKPLINKTTQEHLIALSQKNHPFTKPFAREFNPSLRIKKMIGVWL